MVCFYQLFTYILVFFISFSVFSISSLHNVKAKWIPELRHHCPDVPVILVGIKVDIRNNEEYLKKLTEKDMSVITSEEGAEMARECGCVAYFETSALTGYGISDLFLGAAMVYLKHTTKEKKKKGGCKSQ